MLKVGIIGCGAIGSELARLIHKKFSHLARIAYLCDHNPNRAKALKKKFRRGCALMSIDALIRKSDFVIEAASQEAAIQAVPLALRLKKRMMVLSVGGLLRIPQALLQKTKGLLYIPSGAIGGVDALLAARESRIRHVTLTTYKPLKSLEGAPFFKKRGLHVKKIRKPTVIFNGTAQSAIRLFPQNINVAATLSLAGIGPKRTRVRIVASPRLTRNVHEVSLEGDFGRIRAVTENVPSKTNPKTSALAVHAAVACFEKIFASVKIGT
ncbi:MAG: DUF108 domain-containing protein [Candidatus Omnitrophica bacterium]|nr:DUF108 domain-containing protein [Candidatus Omnitrophota bacterium]